MDAAMLIHSHFLFVLSSRFIHINAAKVKNVL